MITKLKVQVIIANMVIAVEKKYVFLSDIAIVVVVVVVVVVAAAAAAAFVSCCCCCFCNHLLERSMLSVLSVMLPPISFLETITECNWWI